MILRKNSFKSIDFFFRRNHFLLIFLLFLAGQILFWKFFTNKLRPDFTITPNPPSKIERLFLSFGDTHFLYRVLGFKLQNSGDTFGETVPLQDYDYEKLEKWFYALSELDWKSAYIPSIAGFYFIQSQNPRDNEYIVNYLVDVADRDPVRHWQWYVQATYIMSNKLNRPLEAAKIAEKLISIDNPKVLGWARAMAVFAAEKAEDHCLMLEMALRFYNDGTINRMLEDPVYGKGNENRNFLLVSMMKKIIEIKENPSILEKCAKEKIEREKSKK